MKIVEVFQSNGINIICVDRKLTWRERSKKTVKIKDLVLTVNATTNDRCVRNDFIYFFLKFCHNGTPSLKNIIGVNC